MEYKKRKEIVGKRFLCVKNVHKPKLSRLCNWDWRCGIIRAVNRSDANHPALKCLVEWDDRGWEKREWLSVHKAYQVFLVENGLAWTTAAPSNKSNRQPADHRSAALTFEALVDRVGYADHSEIAIEDLISKQISFVNPSTVRPYKEADRCPSSSVEEAVHCWLEQQQGQDLLLNAPSILVGFRLQVYRVHGSTQWYTAVINSYNENTRSISLTDDTVLRETSEDPAKVHMQLLGDGVISSILRGENVGVRPSRTRRSQTEARPPARKTSASSSPRCQKHSQGSSSEESEAVSGGSDKKTSSPRPSVGSSSPRPSSASVSEPCEEKAEPVPEDGSEQPAPVKKQKAKSSKCQLLPESLRVKCNQEGDQDSMHFKKMHLRDYGARKDGEPVPQQTSPTQGSSETATAAVGKEHSGINLNQSLTDQISKMSRTSEASSATSKHNWEDMAAATSLASMSGAYAQDASGRAGAGPSPRGDGPGPGPSPDRPMSSGHMEHNNNKDAADSAWSQRTSSTAYPPHHAENHPPARNTLPATKDSHSKAAGSPLVLDKARNVEPYRDPELLKKDQEIRRMQQGTRPSSVHTMAPTVTSNYAVDAKHPAHPAVTAVTTLAPSATHPLMAAAMPAFAHQLNAQLLQQHLAAGSSLSLLQQQQAAAHMQLQQLMQQQQQQAARSGQPANLLYAHSPMQTHQLEILWQQKYPNMGLPPPWMLHQYQEEVLRDVPMLTQRTSPADIAAMERERRERDIAMERAERERLEQERREKEERERKEREEAERQRQAKVEQERLERERAEAAERERKEQERAQMEVQRRLDRERILMESAALTGNVSDAVNAHFQESLRLASQKRSGGTWNPTPSLPPKHPIPPPPPHSSGAQLQPPVAGSQGSAFTPLGVKPPASPIPKDKDNPEHQAQAQVLASFKQHHAALEASHYQVHQQLLMKQQQQMGEADAKRQAHRPPDASKVKQEQKPFYPASSSASKQEQPNFSLYGYPPYQPMYISRDKLHSLSKEDQMEMDKRAAMSPGNKKAAMNMVSPPPLIKDKAGSSVIVDGKPGEVMFQGHGSHGSITLGTAHGSQHTVKAETKPVPMGNPMPPQAHHKSMHMSNPKQLSPDMQPLDLKQKSKDSSSGRVAQQPPPMPAAYMHNSHAMMQQGAMPNAMYNSAMHHMPAATTAPSTAHSSAMNSMLSQHHASGGEDKKRPAALPSKDSGNKKPRYEECSDNFRSFVENAVQSAFYNDQNRESPPATSSPSATSTTATSSTSSSVLSSLPSSVLTRPGPASTPGGASVGSSCSIMDSINRVVNATNGVNDTDSDTLSAPSPPTLMKVTATEVTPSPMKSNPTKFKKAWLQRYSDEDKKVAADTPPPVAEEEEKSAEDKMLENGEEQTDSMKDCYVNCSYISPTKDGANKSPISLLKDLARTSEDVGTTSASEAESHISNEATATTSKKKVKAKKRRAAQADTSAESKKAKATSDSRPATPAGVSSLKQKAGSRTASPVPRTQTPTPSGSRKQKSKAVKKEKVQSDSDSEAKQSRPCTPKSPTPGKSSKDEKNGQPPSPTAFVSDCEAKMARKWKERSDKGSGLQNPSQVLTNKPLNKEPLTKYKKNQLAFSQDDSCFEITPKLMKCRECRMTPHQKNKKMANIFCRFYAFRRLRYNPKGYLTIAGFSEPSDADAEDIELWMPFTPVNEPCLDLEMAKYIMANVGDRFCELVEQEKGAMAWVSPDTKIAWKRAVQGVREMCDSCDTTLFNFHWVCHKCGFVVCLDCYRLRMRKVSGCSDHKCTTCENQGQKWLTCSANRQPHEPEKLMITQIIPSDVLWVLGRRIHEAREKYGIKANCPCARARVDQLKLKVPLKSNGLTQPSSSTASSSKDEKPLTNGTSSAASSSSSSSSSESALDSSSALSPLSLLAEAAASRESEAKQEEEDKKCSTLRDLLTKNNAKKQQQQQEQQRKQQPSATTLDDIIQTVVERTHPGREGSSSKAHTLSHYVPRHGTTYMAGRDEPIPCYTLTETSLQFPDVPHTWLDYGRLLRLLEPRNSSNIKLFQQQWRRAQPVLVSNCDRYLDMSLWKPTEFSKEFGHLENDLVNCHTNIILLGHKMKVFWDSFERVSSRLKDSKHRPITLKLKDWPPTEDFAELMPGRFQDLMQGLPLPEYTQRHGVFNLASRLPEFFVKPDLGPKMYNAYGSSLTPKSGSTNLHLDVSDAVNMMMYVGVPDDEKEIQEKAALEAMEKAGCCEQTLARVKDGEKPGALWHIYDPQDADKIRDLLNKVAKEQGETIESHHDPIHDQSWYLDEHLRERLLKEYDVQGYTIVQFLGDAVFIPCGGPHQVRNLHSCIKVAEDFVSPENMDYCFKMTQEFRHLSETHSNHEDKLQIKNIIYHAMKDAVAIMMEAK